MSKLEKFDVLITETKQMTYEIEAVSKEAAFEQAKRDYFAEQAQIGIDDSVRVDLEIDGEEIQIDGEDYEMYM